MEAIQSFGLTDLSQEAILAWPRKARGQTKSNGGDLWHAIS